MSGAAPGRPQLAVGVVVFDEQGRVLLVQRGHAPSQGLWSIPGGRVERGETLQEACRRELHAETGISVTLGPLCEVFEHIDEHYHYVVLDYLGAAPQGAVRAGEDAADARFVPLAEVAALPLTAGLLSVLARARAQFQGWRGA